MGKFVRKPKRKRHGKAFWDAEYTAGGHLKLSTEPAEDLEKFTRWLVRYYKKEFLNPTKSVLDLGCGNGRNLIYLAREFGMHGLGFDISESAVQQAKTAAAELPLEFSARLIAGELPVDSESQTIVLDMMTSHFLNAAQRITLRDEVFRVLKPGGWFFLKTFLRDGDLHTKRLLSEHPAEEPGTYIHPVMGMREYVPYEADLLAFLGEHFTIHQHYRSHKHISKGKAHKRRTISVYAQKPLF